MENWLQGVDYSLSLWTRARANRATPGQAESGLSSRERSRGPAGATEPTWLEGPPARAGVWWAGVGIGRRAARLRLRLRSGQPVQRLELAVAAEGQQGPSGANHSVGVGVELQVPFGGLDP